MRTIAVIPARYSSKRLPGKPLVDLLGQTMIERVYRQVRNARDIDDIFVATDDDRIRRTVVAFGGRAVMTSPEHASGSDRIAEAVRDIDVDVVVNVQGDEPLIAPEAIDEVVRLAKEAKGGIATLKRAITSHERLHDPNVVKVVTDVEGFALYFSRSPIPSVASSERLARGVYYEHVGLYAYPKGLLLKLAATPSTTLEQVEKLEQLRALAHGIPIRVGETEHESIAVDTESDLERVRELLGTTAFNDVTT